MSLAIRAHTCRLGDLVAAAFDESMGIVRNHAGTSRLAARVVAAVLVHTGNVRTLRALYGRETIERVATRGGRVRCRARV